MQFNFIHKCVWLGVVSAVLSVGRLNAADFYVAANGISSAGGTIASPWDFSTALSGASGRIHPGDSVWLRGGTYRAPTSNGFGSTVVGTAAAPIVFRNYNNERATLDGRGTEFVLAITGGYVWFWGLEIMDSNPTRVTSQTGGVHPNAYGVAVYAPGVRFINNVVHDTAEGFSAYDLSNDSVFHGNLSYYNGFIAPDRNHGHGYYMQNVKGTKFLTDNFSGDNAVEGFQIYGGGAANVVGFRLIGNVSYNNSSWPYENYQYNYTISGGAQRKDIQFDSNHSFLDPKANYGFNTFGQYTKGTDITVTNNVMVGGYGGPAVSCQGGPVVFTGNKVYVQPGGLNELTLELCSGQTTAGWTWDRNQYYGKTNFLDNGSNVQFATWKSWTGFDATSTMTPSTPTGKWVYIRPNQYEPKRANVIIYNWDLSSSVLVDLSSVLAVGDPYVVHDAQNYYGTPAASGTYNGGSVSIPMVGLQKAVPVGFTTPPHTAPLFGAFVVTSSSGGAGITVIAVPASVTLGSNQQQSFSATVQGSTNQSVTWSISPALGSISSTGVYTAPATITGTPSVTVRATSVADSTRWGTSTVTLSDPSTVTPPPVTVPPPPPTSSWPTPTQSVTLYKEAEAGSLVSPMAIGSDTNASGSQYVSTATASAGSLAVTFNVTVAGTYGLWGRVLSANASSDSFVVSVDGGATDIWDTAENVWSPNWQWRLAVGRGAAGTPAAVNPRLFTLTAGTHTFTLAGRDPNTKIDLLALTNNPAVTPTVPTAPVVTPPPASGTTATAAFVKADSTTQGNWKVAYGTEGYNVIGDTAQYPSYASLTPSGQSFFPWAASTTDVRGLQKASASDRIEATWYSPTSFTLDLNLTDGATHQVAFYSLDFENAGRSQTVDILDAQTSNLLDSQTISGFSGGRYLVWNLKGHVTVRFTNTGNKNAVVGGIFFGAGVGTAANFVKGDATTAGSWKGIYGADGYSLEADSTKLPSYATVTLGGEQMWTWMDSTTDPRGLQKALASDRIEATWFSPTSFTVDVNISDGKTHRIALYCLDFENAGRSQSFTVVDAASNAVLDTRNLSAFSNGQYLVWNVSGHVTIRVTRTGAKNGVVGGIFFN